MFARHSKQAKYPRESLSMGQAAGTDCVLKEAIDRREGRAIKTARSRLEDGNAASVDEGSDQILRYYANMGAGPSQLKLLETREKPTATVFGNAPYRAAEVASPDGS
jgi:hypothetical protein